MPWMAPVLPYLAVAGLTTSAFSSVMSGVSRSAGLQAEGKAAKYNEAVAEQNALAVRTAGDYQERLMRERQARLRGTAKANIGASGVTMAGSPLDMVAENAGSVEREIVAQQYNTRVQAGRYESQAGLYDFEARRDTGMAGYTMAGGVMGAGTTLLGGAYRIFSNYRPSFTGEGGYDIPHP